MALGPNAKNFLLDLYWYTDISSRISCENDQHCAPKGTSFHRMPLKEPALLKQVPVPTLMCVSWQWLNKLKMVDAYIEDKMLTCVASRRMTLLRSLYWRVLSTSHSSTIMLCLRCFIFVHLLSRGSLVRPQQ